MIEVNDNKIQYSTESSALKLSIFQDLLKKLDDSAETITEMFIKIKCSKRRGITLEKLISLTFTINYYKIDSDKEIVYINFVGNAQLMKKDLQVLKLGLTQFN